ncbi:NlpC/P60 family protein [Streptomyces sp. NPDC051445]|uniref:C40 family peptidase n=1 Tax=Streptomyces sp. NPDC051445 TaxID=3365653 RepID=UPI00379FBEFB
MATDRSPRSPGSNTDEPSRAEIQQRVSSLYDRAESDTGNHNLTRAMSGRRPVTSVATGGRGSVDPSLEAVARQWFDMARDRVGPTTPAVLPADRQPARPARTARPASPPERSVESPAVRELEAAPRRAPELTARAVAALPAAPEPRQEEPRALLPAVPAQAAAPALGAVPAQARPAASAPSDRQASLKNTKEQIGRKLSTAREILARALAQPVPSPPAAPSPAATPPTPSLPTSPLAAAGTQQTGTLPVQQPWDTAEQQAFRAEITAAWAGRPPATAGVAAPSDGSDGLLTAGQLGFGAPMPGFSAAPESAYLAPAPVPAPEYLAPELGLTTPPSGYPVAELGLPAPESTFSTHGAGFAVPAGAPVPGYPAPGLGLPTPEPAFPTHGAGFAVPAAAPVPGYATSELDVLTPASGFAVSELPLGVPDSGYATSGFTSAAPSAPAMPPVSVPSYPAPAMDVLTAGVGYPAAVGYPAPAAPLAETVPPAAAPTDATVSTTGPVYLGKADKALSFARAQIGRPCVMGATGPESYDCSSLTQAAWRAAGVTLPRTAIDQAKAFTRISLAELRPGDLVFFFDDLSHTGLCTGNGMMIHAPGPGASIREEAILPFGEGALRGAVRPA